MSVFVKASVAALQDQPIVNACMTYFIYISHYKIYCFYLYFLLFIFIFSIAFSCMLNLFLQSSKKKKLCTETVSYSQVYNTICFFDFCEDNDISVAVATPRGLVVPVLRDCQNKSMAGIHTIYFYYFWFIAHYYC